VLLDVMMPVRDGWLVAEDIAGDPTISDLPIVFLTARTDRRDRERAHSLGAVGYLTKPLNPVGLSAAIDEILGGSSGRARAGASRVAHRRVGPSACL